MIIAEPQNMLRNYMGLGFDKGLRKLSDDYYRGSEKDNGFTSSLEMDGQIEGIGSNKITSNKFDHTIDLGAVKLNGAKGRIDVYEGPRLVGIIGKFDA